MAGILQNVFSKGIYTLKDPENVSKLKTLVNHSALYFGLIVYTAIGAKVFQILEYPAELEEKEVKNNKPRIGHSLMPFISASSHPQQLGLET